MYLYCSDYPFPDNEQFSFQNKFLWYLDCYLFSVGYFAGISGSFATSSTKTHTRSVAPTGGKSTSCIPDTGLSNPEVTEVRNPPTPTSMSDTVEFTEDEDDLPLNRLKNITPVSVSVIPEEEEPLEVDLDDDVSVASSQTVSVSWKPKKLSKADASQAPARTRKNTANKGQSTASATDYYNKMLEIEAKKTRYIKKEYKLKKDYYKEKLKFLRDKNKEDPMCTSQVNIGRGGCQGSSNNNSGMMPYSAIVTMTSTNQQAAHGTGETSYISMSNVNVPVEQVTESRPASGMMWQTLGQFRESYNYP